VQAAMEARMDGGIFKEGLLAYAAALRFLLTTLPGLLLLGAILTLLFGFRLWSVARQRQLACQAAGQTLRWPERLALLFKEVSAMGAALVAGLPAILAVLAISGTVYAVADSLERFDRIQENARRISELTTVLRNLEQRHRVAEVQVRSAANGLVKLDLNYFLPGDSSTVAGHQYIEIAGTTIYFDAIVCNFDYTEIAAGRRVNLAIPYRVFSDRVPQIQGISLALRDSAGVPYMYKQADDQIYGLTPEIYHARLAELMQLLDNEPAARLNGIVRSVYGSAVHRRVQSGDRFTIWVEQSGGLVIKTPADF